MAAPEIIGMTIFAKSTLSGIARAKIQSQIEALQTSLRAPHDVMMFSAWTEDRSMEDIYIGLPGRSLLSLFPGFVEVTREDIPDFLVTLVVQEDGFKRRFPDIYSKRRSRIPAYRRT